MSILAPIGCSHFAAKSMRHKLQSIADSEHRQAKVEDAGIGGGRIRIIDRRWSAGENDSDRRVLTNFFDFCVTREDRREDVLFADAAGYELRILCPEIEDNNRLSFHG